MTTFETNALELKDLCKSYPGFSLDHLNLPLPSGCILGLIGENGAGSTIGQKGAFYAAKVIAATAYDLYTQPELRKEIQDEFDAQDREPYAPMYDGE